MTSIMHRRGSKENSRKRALQLTQTRTAGGYGRINVVRVVVTINAAVDVVVIPVAAPVNAVVVVDVVGVDDVVVLAVGAARAVEEAATARGAAGRSAVQR